MQLVTALDQDGPEPRDDPPPVNELFLTPSRDGGGTITGRFGDAALWGAITTLIEARTAPRSTEDPRSTAQRRADALGEVCGYVLAHGDLPQTGGHRPTPDGHRHSRRPGAPCPRAVLDLGGTLTPAALRRLCCDAAVIPVVLGGAGQPLDVGRATRTIPDGLRRAVAARDRGCAFPGCDRPPSWAEVHHVVEWQHGGPTEINNLVMLCGRHHRVLHESELDRPDPRRVAGVRATSLDRPRSAGPAQTPGCRRSTARYPTTRHQTGAELGCGSWRAAPHSPREAGALASAPNGGGGPG